MEQESSYEQVGMSSTIASFISLVIRDPEKEELLLITIPYMMVDETLVERLGIRHPSLKNIIDLVFLDIKSSIARF